MAKYKRILVLRLGDNVLLRWIHDCYASLAPHSATSTKHGVATLVDSSTNYLSAHAKKAFSTRLEKDEDASLYIIGHSSAGASHLYSLDYYPGPSLFSAPKLAGNLNTVLTNLEIDRENKSNLIIIKLLACGAAADNHQHDSYAISLLKELHRIGYRNIMLKANTGRVTIPIFGHSFALGQVKNFYLKEDTIYEISSGKDAYYRVVCVLRKCQQKTDDVKKQNYLQNKLSKVKNLGFSPKHDDVVTLQEIIDEARKSDVLNRYNYRRHTAWFMRFFTNPTTSTRRALNSLKQEISSSKFNPEKNTRSKTIRHGNQ